MHECVNIYFSNKNKNYVHKSLIFRDKHQFFMNGLIDKSFIFRDGYQNFLNGLIDKSFIFRNESQISLIV